MTAPRLAILLSLLLAFAAASTGSRSAAGPAAAPATPLERAKELLTADKPAEALKALADYHPAPEEQSLFHYTCARSLLALKRPYDSIEHYRLAYIHAVTPADKERLLLERADVYAAMRYFSEAAVCYEVFLRQFPKSTFTERAQLGIAECRIRSGEYREALEHFEKAGTTSRALAGRANALQALGRTEEARTLYRDVLDHDPKAVAASQETLLSVGENFRVTGHPSDARVYFESVKDPVLKYRASLGLGKVGMAENKPEAAVVHFAAATESPERPVRSEAFVQLADANMRLGRFDAVRQALEEIRNKYPYSAQSDGAVLLLAKLDIKEGRKAEAITLLKTLVFRRNPVPAALDEIDAMVLEAAKAEDPAGLLELWRTAGRWLLDPSRSPDLVKVARALRHHGKPFLEICSWLIKYGSDAAKAEARFLLADFYAALGDASTAESYLKRSRIKDRQDESARVRATLALAKNNPRLASEALLSIRKPGEEDLLRLITIMPFLKDVSRASAYCERALRDRPASVGTSVRFADALYASGRALQALAQYRAAVRGAQKERPADAAAKADLEWAHYRISVIAKGEDALASLKAIGMENDTVGRLAAAELRGRELLGKVE